VRETEQRGEKLGEEENETRGDRVRQKMG